MSEENVDLIRRVNEAWAAHDMDALLDLHHRDVEIVVLRSKIEGPFLGHRGLRRMAAEVFDHHLEFRYDELRDCGDRVLVLGRQNGEVRGLPWDHTLIEVYEIVDGKVARLEAFETVEEALAAVATAAGPGEPSP